MVATAAAVMVVVVMRHYFQRVLGEELFVTPRVLAANHGRVSAGRDDGDAGDRGDESNREGEHPWPLGGTLLG